MVSQFQSLATVGFGVDGCLAVERWCDPQCAKAYAAIGDRRRELRGLISGSQRSPDGSL